MPAQPKKVTIVGSGSIGSTLAYSLLLRRPELDIVLCNRSERKAWAKAFDMSHCAPLLGPGRVRAGTLGDAEGSAAIVVTAGVLPKENGTRADVLRDNVEVYRGLVPALAAGSPGALIVAVTNPVDALAYAAYRLAGSPEGRVVGSGTALDGMRLRAFVAEAYGLDAALVRTELVGEHGDTMVPLWSRASYGDRPLAEALRERGAELDAAAKAALLERTRRAGWEIRLAGEHSCYGIAFSACRIVEAALGPATESLNVSSMLSGEYGIEGAWLSLPTLIGPGGAAGRRAPELAAEELAALRASARAVRAQMDEVDRLLG